MVSKQLIISKGLIMVIFIITSCFVVPHKTQAKIDQYPKLANFYYEWSIADEDIDKLAKWEMVILSQQLFDYSYDSFAKLKQKNPDIKILIYVPCQEILNDPVLLDSSPFWRKIYNKVDSNDWWLKTDNNQHVSWWSTSWLINPNTKNANGETWTDYIPNLVNNEILKDPYIDGVFYDNVWAEIGFLNQPIDINNDGKADHISYVNQQWQQGTNKILTKTRQLAPDKIIVGNTNSNLYNNNLNGRLHESFPYTYTGSWDKSMDNYLNNNLGHEPRYYLINANTNNTGNQADYRSFRYGLTSTLMGDGYYSFDYGDQAHNSMWWYDEYEVYLGTSVSDNKNVLNPSSTQMTKSVWQRDFQNGVTLVNSTNQKQKVSFNEEFEKIKGVQDPNTNNGAVIKSVTLNPEDGIVLLRRIEDIKNSSFYNGSFVRAFDKYGDSVRNGFFIYEKQHRGGYVIAKQDINKDGKLELIVADNYKVTIYGTNNNVITTFYPYGNDYNKGINFAVADFDNDGYMEIVTGTMKGYKPLVKIFNYQGKELNEGFYAYAPTYMGGVNVAVGDTNGNGKKEIVTGAGHMGGPQVRIFDINGKVLSGGFFAYNKSFRGGVYVACGDIDGNGIDEIVTGAGYGGSSHVRYFNSKFEPLSPGFWAFGKDSRTGVKVITNDLNNDGKAEILAASPDTFTTALNKIK